jgi:hypothetical protein
VTKELRDRERSKDIRNRTIVRLYCHRELLGRMSIPKKMLYPVLENSWFRVHLEFPVSEL